MTHPPKLGHYSLVIRNTMVSDDIFFPRHRFWSVIISNARARFSEMTIMLFSVLLRMDFSYMELPFCHFVTFFPAMRFSIVRTNRRSNFSTHRMLQKMFPSLRFLTENQAKLRIEIHQTLFRISLSTPFSSTKPMISIL